MVSIGKHSQTCVYLQTKQTGLLWGRSDSEVLAHSIKMTRGVFFLSCYDVFDVIEWFSQKNTQKLAFTFKLSKPSCSGAVGDPFYEVHALLVKTTRGMFFFSRYDVFYIIEWLQWENTEKLMFTCKLRKPGYSYAVRDPFCEVRALSVKQTRVVFFFSYYDVFDVIEWFPWEKHPKTCVNLETMQTGLF